MAHGRWPIIDNDETRTLPADCPLLSQHNILKDMVLALNLELIEIFGPGAILGVQRINPESVEYREVGLRWFVILPWPQIDGEQHERLMRHVYDRIRAFDPIIGAESFGCTSIAAGGVKVFMVGLREHKLAQE